jgi:hypothetical protein
MPPEQLKMYYFALAFQMEMPYPLAPPQGWEAVLIFENLAFSNQHSAFSQSHTQAHRKGHEGIQRKCPQLHAKSKPNAETHANMGWSGIHPSQVHANLG